MLTLIVILLISCSCSAMSPKTKRLSWELAQATQLGETETVHTLLEKEPPLAILINGKAALHRAAHQGFLAIVDLLLIHGAKKEIKDKRGRTALHCAIRKKNLLVMKLLIARGADIMAQDTRLQTPLHKAARNGFTQGVQLLLAVGADVHAVDYRGNSPLHYAVLSGSEETLSLIAHPSASLCPRNHRLETPLHRAARKRKKSACRLLLKLIAAQYIKQELPLMRKRLAAALLVLKRLSVSRDLIGLILCQPTLKTGLLFCSVKEDSFVEAIPYTVIINGTKIPIAPSEVKALAGLYLEEVLSPACSLTDKKGKMPGEVSGSPTLINLLDPRLIRQHALTILAYSFGAYSTGE